MTDHQSDQLFEQIGPVLKYFSVEGRSPKGMLFDPKESIDFNETQGPLFNIPTPIQTI